MIDVNKQMLPLAIGNSNVKLDPSAKPSADTPHTPFTFDHYGKQEEMAPFPKEYDPDSSEFKANTKPSKNCLGKENECFDPEILRMLAKKQKKTGKRVSANDYYHCAAMKRIEKERAKKLAERRRVEKQFEENQRIY